MHSSSVDHLILIASSFGGPDALDVFLTAMGVVPAPVIIAQHMITGGENNMMQRFRKRTGLQVSSFGERSDDFQPGAPILLPGGRDGMMKLGTNGRFHLEGCSSPAPWHPCADVLFGSAIEAVRNSGRPIGIIGVVLTGMGCDGAAGSLNLRCNGHRVLVQDPKEAAMDSMPLAAIRMDAASQILPLEGLGKKIRDMVGVA